MGAKLKKNGSGPNQYSYDMRGYYSNRYNNVIRNVYYSAKLRKK